MICCPDSKGPLLEGPREDKNDDKWHRLMEEKTEKKLGSNSNLMRVDPEASIEKRSPLQLHIEKRKKTLKISMDEAKRKWEESQSTGIELKFLEDLDTLQAHPEKNEVEPEYIWQEQTK